MMPRRCSACGKLCKNHSGPTGKNCPDGQDKTKSPSAQEDPTSTVEGSNANSTPDFSTFTVEQLRQYAMNASATIGNLQSAAGSGSTPPVGAGEINAAADQLRAARCPPHRTPGPSSPTPRR